MVALILLYITKYQEGETKNCARDKTLFMFSHGNNSRQNQTRVIAFGFGVIASLFLK
jgi:hypothetical protein